MTTSELLKTHKKIMLYDNTIDIYELFQNIFFSSTGSDSRIVLAGAEFIRSLKKLINNNYEDVIMCSNFISNNINGYTIYGMRNLYGTLFFANYSDFDGIGMSDCAIALDLEEFSNMPNLKIDITIMTDEFLRLQHSKAEVTIYRKLIENSKNIQAAFSIFKKL